MFSLKRAIEVKALNDYHIWIRFEDGVAGEVDLRHLAGRGIFRAWSDPKVFASVAVDSSGAVVWDDGIDLCPDALYLRLTGKTVEELFPKVKPAPVDA